MSAVAATLKTALAEAWSNRRSFWFQVSVMIANDLAFIAFWLLFFNKVGEVRGWDGQRVLLLFSILAMVTGISLGLFANCRRIGQIAADGELDAVLTLPVHPLPYLLTRRIETALLGDLIFAPLLFILAGEPTLERTAVFLLASLCGSLVMVGFLVILGSLTMFIGGRGEVADLGFQAVLILASYPLDVFVGVIKVLLFTAVPAAFITGLPTTLVDDFSLRGAATLVSVAVLFAVLAWIVFTLGLRRYSSGALWTRA